MTRYFPTLYSTTGVPSRPQARCLRRHLNISALAPMESLRHTTLGMPPAILSVHA